MKNMGQPLLNLEDNESKAQTLMQPCKILYQIACWDLI